MSAAQVNAMVAASLTGDRKAARELTERILLPVIDASVSRRLLKTDEPRFDKKDAIQAVFEHLYKDDWKALRSFDPNKGSLPNYVWAIADKWIRDHVRSLPPPRPVEDMDRDASPDSGPERRAELAELLDRLQRELTAEELALFQWLYVEEISHTDAAGRLGIAVEATHKRAQRLEAKVRAIVSGEAAKEPQKGGKR